MSFGLIVKLRPLGPARFGAPAGDPERCALTFASDSLYGAVCWAMNRAGALEEWLDATARREDPLVRLSSCFPFQGDTRFVPPPVTHWPPAPTAKVRWKAAQFVPVPVVETVLAGAMLDEEKWSVDGPSRCLVPNGKSGPLRPSMRSAAALDRVTGAAYGRNVACVEFEADSGIWTLAAFPAEEALQTWGPRLRAAFRYLADSGIGGERSIGWGACAAPEFLEGPLPGLILAPAAEPADPAREQAYWMLSLFSESAADEIDWTRSSYRLVRREGRVLSDAAPGASKLPSEMVEEGSVLVARRPPSGSAPDVAPEGFPHPVYRNGFAVAIPLPQGGVA